jgi:hypothetical protein
VNCPSCGRPVAVARATCLYCGRALPQEAVEAVRAATAVVAAEQPVSRTLLVLDLHEASAEAVASALGASVYEAKQRMSRGGFQLLRALPPAEAEAEAERLTQSGLVVHRLQEAEARLVPLAVRGGACSPDGTLSLRGEAGRVEVPAADVRVVVKGPIVRDYQTRPTRKALRLATLEPGYRFHLHRRSALPPVEIDPWAFEFGSGHSGSSLITLAEWIADLGAPVDDHFRHEPPALSPAAPADAGLHAAASLASARPKKGESVILDNVAQFRFYSGWRGLLARLLAS